MLDILRLEFVHCLLIVPVVVQTKEFKASEDVKPVSVGNPGLRYFLLEILLGHVEFLCGRAFGSERLQIPEAGLVSNATWIIAAGLGRAFMVA